MTKMNWRLLAALKDGLYMTAVNSRSLATLRDDTG